jgi:molybdenum cofactor guanylyltransferase
VEMNQVKTGVILAGGRNSRFQGEDKAFLKINEMTIFERIYSLFRCFFDEIIVITNHPEKYLAWDVLIATDLFQASSALTGIHAGLFYSSSPFAFFSACDTPFLKKAVIRYLLDNVETDKAIVVPETLMGFEPLCAVYSNKCLKIIENQIKNNEHRIKKFFRKTSVKKISEEVLRSFDPQLDSFFNINTPEDFKKARQLISHQ